jgi:hypothetical protein
MCGNPIYFRDTDGSPLKLGNYLMSKCPPEPKIEDAQFYWIQPFGTKNALMTFEVEWHKTNHGSGDYIDLDNWIEEETLEVEFNKSGYGILPRMLSSADIYHDEQEVINAKSL